MASPALPFFLGGASLLLSVAVQRLVEHNLIKDHRAAMTDGSANAYNVPPALEEESLRRRIGRDNDALTAVAYVASIVSAAIVLFDRNSNLFLVALGVGLLLPVTALAILLTVDPIRYSQLFWLKRSFPLSPFVYVALIASTAVGSAVLIVDPSVTPDTDKPAIVVTR
jgi:hypothetical protein